MRGILWYIVRGVKYYILKPNYKKVYGSFGDYCRYRKDYEKGHRRRKS